jgi:hypothetical protein
MGLPYGPPIIKDCVTCEVRGEGYFCDFAAVGFETVKCLTIFPHGAILFVEGQSPSGAFMRRTGQVKLCTCSIDGKTFIPRIAEPSKVPGLRATVSGRPYEVTPITRSSCQISFIRRGDFLRCLSKNSQNIQMKGSTLIILDLIALDSVTVYGKAGRPSKAESKDLKLPVKKKTGASTGAKKARATEVQGYANLHTNGYAN